MHVWINGGKYTFTPVRCHKDPCDMTAEELEELYLKVVDEYTLLSRNDQNAPNSHSISIKMHYHERWLQSLEYLLSQRGVDI